VPVQDADDLDPLPDRAVDHQMHASGMDPDGWRELRAFAGHLGESGKKVEQREKPVGVTVCLIETPVFGALTPNAGQVVFRGWAKHPAIGCSHAARAFLP